MIQKCLKKHIKLMSKKYIMFFIWSNNKLKKKNSFFLKKEI